MTISQNWMVSVETMVLSWRYLWAVFVEDILKESENDWTSDVEEVGERGG